jgi:hypothetical protein
MTETSPEKRLIGYARVSTYGQTLDSQLDQLRKAGCTSRNIYREKVTGARADRRELNRMLGKLAVGDVVTVTRIDRLARSTFDLFAIVKRIVDAKAQFRSLAEPWADTGTSTGRLVPRLAPDKLSRMAQTFSELTIYSSLYALSPAGNAAYLDSIEAYIARLERIVGE